MDDKKHPSQPQTSKDTGSAGPAGPGASAGSATQPGQARQPSPSSTSGAGNTPGNPPGTRPEIPGQKASPQPAELSAHPSRRLFSRKWLYPAIYLGAAALIIGLMYVRSQAGGASPATSRDITGTPAGQTQTTQSVPQGWQAPYAAGTQAQTTLGFFPAKGTTTEQADTMVMYDNAWYPHEGIDIKAQGGQPFTVTAALAGKVSSVIDNPLKGKTVIVQSADGYTERYESLSTIDTKDGATIMAGETIGTSGTNQFEASQGNHLYFAVYKDGQPINPVSVLPKM